MKRSRAKLKLSGVIAAKSYTLGGVSNSRLVASHCDRRDGSPQVPTPEPGE